jgi:hypothetical protein
MVSNPLPAKALNRCQHVAIYQAAPPAATDHDALTPLSMTTRTPSES